MKLHDRLKRLESFIDDLPDNRGIKFEIDGLIPDTYELTAGGKVVEIIKRGDHEPQDDFEARAQQAMEAEAQRQGKHGLGPIMWPKRPPIESGVHISPATGQPIRVTIGGQQ